MLPGDDVDEGRLAGSVVAEEGMHLASTQLESRRRRAR